MSELLDLQQKFAKLVGVLIGWIYEHPGWEVTGGDWNRADGKGHMANSLHYQRLALDLNLFVDDVYQYENGPEWQAIGAFWKSLDSDCAWGGDFPKVDLNHVSLRYQGRE